jgi:hypothetical protein
VYSTDYHAKHFCRFELEAAVKRHIQGTMVIVPVRCGDAQVPRQADSVQFVRADAPGFMAQLKAKLEEIWRADLRDASSPGLLNRGRGGHHSARQQ